MYRTSPFHERTSALSETGLWEHWANHLTAVKYQSSEKAEYFAIRNSAGLFDSSPLFKYRFHGPDAERFLAGVMARDPRTLAVGRAQYTLWCDDRGFVIEDGVLLRTAADDFLLTAAEPNLAYFSDLAGRLDVGIQDVSDAYAVLAVQGPRSRALLGRVATGVEELPYFGLAMTSIGGVDVIVSRTGYTGDLGYEIWVPEDGAIAVWDAVWDAGRGYGVVPFGMLALYMARIEAGLILLDADFRSSRFAWTDKDRTTPVELGFERLFRDIDTTDRAFVGRDAIRRELAEGTSRWKLTGLTVSWQDWDRLHDAAGMIPPKDHTPIQDEYYLYDDDLHQIGYASSLMYSPMLQRHIALARVPLDRQAPGSRVKLEWPVNHRYEYFEAEVARLPLFDPPRRTA
ncbi:MAG: aminomethyl transferase family protein [Chloroflexi bacterium]|nr:aminomethyl transferase family protein [Chloroflexota bacterium]